MDIGIRTCPRTVGVFLLLLDYFGVLGDSVAFFRFFFRQQSHAQQVRRHWHTVGIFRWQVRFEVFSDVLKLDGVRTAIFVLEKTHNVRTRVRIEKRVQ